MAALIVAAGVGTLVTSQPVLLQVLTGVGAVYLLWMGLSLSMRPASISSDQIAIASSKSWYIRGVYLSGLNPKVLLLFLALSTRKRLCHPPLKLFYWRGFTS